MAKTKGKKPAPEPKKAKPAGDLGTTFLGQLHQIIVEGYDEPNAKQATLKAQIKTQAKQIDEHREDIRQLSRDAKDIKSESEAAKTGKSLAGLERDVERMSVTLATLKEDRRHLRETMKQADDQIRSLIKDRASGQMRIDDPPETPEVKTHGRASAGQKNATPPPSKSQESPSVDHPPLERVDKTTGEVLRKPLALARA